MEMMGGPGLIPMVICVPIPHLGASEQLTDAAAAGTLTLREKMQKEEGHMWIFASF